MPQVGAFKESVLDIPGWGPQPAKGFIQWIYYSFIGLKVNDGSTRVFYYFYYFLLAAPKTFSF